MEPETFNRAINTGMQISQTYKEDFTGFLIFGLVIVATALGVLFCGITWSLYKSVLYNTKRGEGREALLHEKLDAVQKTATELSATNTELTRINGDLVKTNAELVRSNTDVYNNVKQRLGVLERIESDIEEIKTNIAIISKQ